MTAENQYKAKQWLINIIAAITPVLLGVAINYWSNSVQELKSINITLMQINGANQLQDNKIEDIKADIKELKSRDEKHGNELEKLKDKFYSHEAAHH